MRLFNYFCFSILGLLCGLQSVQAQTVIFSNAGASYNNTDAVTTDTYGPVNISNCTSVSFSINYNFSLPFPGASNMESSDECPFGLPPCAGDPNDPYGGGCDQCWDFFYVQFQIDGVNVNTQLIGVPGFTNQSGTLTFGPICTQNAATAGFVVQTNTWAANEMITFSNLTITCWDASASNLSVNPSPVCSGAPFTLTAALTQPASVMGTLWTGPGTINSPNNLITTVTGAPIGTNTYTFTATDDNACTQSSTIDVEVGNGPTVNDPPNQAVCSGDPVNVVFSGTGSPVYNWTNTNPAIGLPANGNGDINFTAANVASTTTGTITVTPVEGICTGPAQTFTITVNPLPTVNQPNNVAVCAGLPVNVAFSGTAGSTFPWTNDNPAIGLGASGTGNINFNSALVASIQTATITITPTKNGCPGIPVTFTITVTPSPTVQDPPNESVCSGDMVQVPFMGTGSPTYTWTNSNPAIGLPANGMGDLNFTAAIVATPTTGTITVTPSENGCPGPSQNFTITVKPIPFINPVADQAYCPGDTYIVNYPGTIGATMTWTNDNFNGLMWGDGFIVYLPPFTSSFIVPPVTTQEIINFVVTPSLNGCVGTPITHTVTVNPVPTLLDPPNQSVCSGEQVDVFFSSTGNPVISWTNSNPAIGLGASGTGNISFTAANVPVNTTGNIAVTASVGNCMVTQNFTITVGPPPTINPAPNVTVCGGLPVTSPFSGSPGATFTWTNSNTSIGLGASGNGNINFTSFGVATQQVGNITVTPNIGGCAGTPTTFSITVNPTPTVMDPPNQTVCPGDGVSVVFSGTGSPTFSWTNSNPAIGIGANGMGDISFTAANVPISTTGNFTVTPSGNGCTGPAQNFSITVTLAPTVIQPNNLSACGGTNVNLFFIGTLGANFNWTNSNPAIGLAASGNGDLNFIAAPVATPQTATITVTPIIGTCAGVPQTFNIVIDPAPSVTDPANQTICSGTPVAVNFTGSSNATFNWTNNNPAIGLGASGTGNIAFNAGSVGVGTITVTPSANGCDGPSQVFDITVIGSPTVIQPANLIACAANPVAVAFTGTSGATFSWVNNNPAIGLGASGTGDIGFTAAGVGAVTTATITVTPSLGVCTGTPQSFDITLNPLPTINITSVTCAAGLLTYDIVLTTTGNNLVSSAGTVSGSAGNYTVSGITTGTNVMLTSLTTNCQFQQNVNAPNCNCAAVNPPTTPNNPTICEGEATPVLLVVVDPGNTVDWYAAPSGGAPLLNGSPGFLPMGTFTAGVYNFYAEARELATGCLSPTRLLVTLTVNAVPSVMAVSDLMVCNGATVTVEFMGTPSANMNWTNDNTGIGLAASGSGNIGFVANYTGTNANIQVTPALNGCFGQPINFVIAVNDIPTVMLPANQTVCAGAPVSIVFSGTNGAMFDWANSDASIGLGISGTGDISFTAANVATPTLANLAVTPTAFGCTGATQNFSITVNPVPDVTAPGNQTACAGATVLVSFSGTSGASFDWTNSNTAIGLGASGTGNISFPGTNSGNAPLTANLVVTPTLNGCPGAAQNFSITINPLPTLVVNNTTCASDLMSYSINATSTATMFTSSAGTVTGSGVYNITNIPLGTNVVLTANNTVTNCTQQVSVSAPNCTCPPIMPPNGPNFPIICEGTATPALMVNAGAGLTVDWYANPVGGVALSMGSATFTPPGVFTPGTYTFYAESREISSNCTSATRTPVTLTVNAAPTMTQPIDQAVCAGFVISVGFNGSSGSNYTWTNSNPAIGLAASGSGSISFTAVNPGNAPLVATIVVTQSLFGCMGQPKTFTITVNPSPTMTDPTDVSACAGQAVAVNFSAATGATFSWTNNNSNIGLGASGTGNINFTTSGAGTSVVTVVPMINGCSGAPQTFNITVLANPSMNNPGNLNACAGAPVAVNFTGDPGVNCSWTNSNAAIGLSGSGTGNITFTASNVTTVQSAQITAIPKLGACSGAPQIFTITINPAPVVTIAGTTSICNGDATTLTALGGATFNWSGGQNTAAIDVSPTSTTTYTATVSSAATCTATGSVTVTVNQASTATVNAVTCDPLQVGTTTNTILNAAGCDSVITTITTLQILNAQAMAVLAFGQYAISCNGSSDATINGSVTGGTAAYQYTWSVPGQNSATLTGVGEGTYSVTVTDANQCSATSSVTIVAPPPLDFDIALADVECGESSANATITPVGGVMPFAVSIDGILSGGGLTPSIPAGIHAVELSDANGCTADSLVNVILPLVPTISLPAQASVALGETLVIQAQTNLDTWLSLVWNPVADTSCVNCLRQEWVPDVSRTYEVIITDSLGCFASAAINVLVEKRIDLYIPNVFSPDLNGINDFWELNAGPSVIALNSLQIFDRWGDMVYFWDSPIPVNEWTGWDGRNRGERVNPGVFVYYLEVKLANGETVVKKGDLTVVR